MFRCPKIRGICGGPNNKDCSILGVCIGAPWGPHSQKLPNPPVRSCGVAVQSNFDFEEDSGWIVKGE